MDYSLIFVEGATDSALLTAALQVIGFDPCKNITDIPDCVIAHFPRSFPSTGQRLNRVNSYPEVLKRGDHCVAILSTGGFTRLGKALQQAVLLTKDGLPKNVIIFTDADDKLEADRFQEAAGVLRASFIEFSHDRLGVTGIEHPEEIAKMREGQVNTGVYIWPGNGELGTLERVILRGIEAQYPEVYEIAYPVAEQVRNTLDSTHEVHRALSSGFDIDKARVMILGSAINPSSSVSVFVAAKAHKLDNFFRAPALMRVIEFLEVAFPSQSTNVSTDNC